MKRKLFLVFLLALMVIMPVGTTLAQDNDPPVPPKGNKTFLKDESTSYYSYEENETVVHVIEETKSFEKKNTPKSGKDKGGFSPLVVIWDGPARMTATHVLYYVEQWWGYDYGAWSSASTSSNYTSYYIYIWWRHLWGGSCQNMLTNSDHYHNNSTYVDRVGSRTGFDSGTKHCVWGQHRALRYSYPDYDLNHTGTFPIFTLP